MSDRSRLHLGWKGSSRSVGHLISRLAAAARQIFRQDSRAYREVLGQRQVLIPRFLGLPDERSNPFDGGPLVLGKASRGQCVQQLPSSLDADVDLLVKVSTLFGGKNRAKLRQFRRVCRRRARFLDRGLADWPGARYRLAHRRFGGIAGRDACKWPGGFRRRAFRDRLSRRQLGSSLRSRNGTAGPRRGLRRRGCRRSRSGGGRDDTLAGARADKQGDRQTDRRGGGPRKRSRSLG